MGEILYRDESYSIMGACFEVYNEKGPGFLEAVYQECLEIEFNLRRIPFVAQAELTLTYKGRTLRKKYQPDFLCYDKIIVEVKAVGALADEFRAQVHNYLKATGLRLGLLVNFGHKEKLEYSRIVR
jgi:GxxExxY protein